MAIDKNRKSRKYRAALIDAVSHERLWSIVFTRPAFITAVPVGAVTSTQGWSVRSKPCETTPLSGV